MVTLAVLIPCLNEGAAVTSVVRDFQAVLPGATVYVYDNGSTDDTAEQARNAGAMLRVEPLRGKGNVVRRMFADIDAQIYVMVDGDGTYDAASAPRMIERLVAEQLDMVVGARVAPQGSNAYRFGHVWGNRALTAVIASLFGRRLTDVFSGYRVFSRRLVKSFPIDSTGFEIEAELSIHTLQLGLPVAEISVPYQARAAGSVSKLATWRDGARISAMILKLHQNERPILFFSAVALALAFLAVGLAVPIFQTYVETGLVPRFPTAILSASIMLVAFTSFVCGILLDSVTRGRREAKRMSYLSFAPVVADRALRNESTRLPRSVNSY